MKPRRVIALAVLAGALVTTSAVANDVGFSVGVTSAATNGSNLAFGVDLRVPLALGLTFQAVGESGGGNLTGRAFGTFTFALAYVGPGVFFRYPLATGGQASYGPAAVAGIELALPVLPSVFAEAYGEYDISPVGQHAGGARAGLRLRF
jgi:hypothetical protein